VYRSRHGKMNEAIVELENESNKLSSFNKQGHFDIHHLHHTMQNTISSGVENFKQFYEDTNEFIKMELKEKSLVLEALKEEHENLKKEKVEVDKDRGLTAEEINNELKAKRDQLEQLEKTNTERENQWAKLRSMIFITSEDLKKIMNPKLIKLKSN